MAIPQSPPFAVERHAGLEISEPIAAEAAGPAVDERRTSARRQAGMWASLLTLDGRELLRCTTDDVAEGGMHLTTPVGFGLAVGQRYEVLLGRDSDDRQQPSLLGEGHYATVVRTQFHLGEYGPGDGDRVGVGLRFDQPLVL